MESPCIPVRYLDASALGFSIVSFRHVKIALAAVFGTLILIDSRSSRNRHQYPRQYLSSTSAVVILMRWASAVLDYPFRDLHLVWSKIRILFASEVRRPVTYSIGMSLEALDNKLNPQAFIRCDPRFWLLIQTTEVPRCRHKNDLGLGAVVFHFAIRSALPCSFYADTEHFSSEPKILLQLLSDGGASQRTFEYT